MVGCEPGCVAIMSICGFKALKIVTINDDFIKPNTLFADDMIYISKAKF